MSLQFPDKSPILILFFGFSLFLASCNNDKKNTSETEGKSAETKSSAITLIKTPDFNPDSAYAFVKVQVNFGPRVPNTAAHKACQKWIEQKLKQYGAELTVQDFKATAFTGTELDLHNLIGSINPKATKRILLAAHWDSRPFADHDTKDKDKPIDGANDGASGVAVLLEVARNLQLANPKPEIGVDIIFFDGEDYGDTEAYEPKEGEENGKWWCLGSKYWAEHKHQPNYSAWFGILLDMVGNRNARFAREGGSMIFAPTVVTKVWDNAKALGYGQVFTDNQVEGITDDHVFVNTRAKINMIDIIEYDNSDGAYFSNTWHTHNDNLANIDPQTMKAVGQTLLQTLWQEASRKE